MTGREYHQKILNKTQFILSSPFSEDYPRAAMELRIDLEKTKDLFERVEKTNVGNSTETQQILDDAIKNLEDNIHKASIHLVLCVELLDAEVIFPANKQIEKAKAMLKQDPTNKELKNSLTSLENEITKLKNDSAVWSNYGAVPSVKLTTLIRQLTHNVETQIHNSMPVNLSEFANFQFTLNQKLQTIQNAADALALRENTLNSRVDDMQATFMILAIPTAVLAFVLICKTPTLITPIKFFGGKIKTAAGFAASGFGLFAPDDAKPDTNNNQEYVSLSPSPV